MIDLLYFKGTAKTSKTIPPINGKIVKGIEPYELILSGFGATFNPSAIPPIQGKVYYIKRWIANAYVSNYVAGNQAFISSTFDISSNFWGLFPNSVIDSNDSASNIRILNMDYNDLLFKEATISGVGELSSQYYVNLHGYILTLEDE